MGYNQPMQYSPQEQFVQIPLNIEHDRTIPINQTSYSNRRRNKWLTIIICIIFAATGQSMARLLENYYFLHKDRSGGFGIWTQSLLQVVGFPILFVPFLLLLLLLKKQKQLLITSGGISRKQLAMIYPIICIYMFSHAIFSNIKHRIPFRFFTLIYTTQLLFTPVISSFLNKIKFNRWMVTSLAFSILAGAFTLNTFSAGSPIYNWKTSSYWRMYTAFCAAFFFSLLLCTIRTVFEELISVCNTNRKQPCFAVDIELLIITSLLATAFLVAAVFSNVTSVCTWPIVSLLVAFLYSTYDQFDVFRGIALGAAALSVASYIYLIHKEKSDDNEATS